MRILVLSLTLVASNFMKVCESSDEAKPGAAASASLSAEGQTGAGATAQANGALSAQFGGTVVPVGDHFVEIMAHERGLVDATVRAKDGHALTAADNVELSVKASAKGNARPDIKLLWDGPSARFRGGAGADVQLVPQPMDISLSIGGKAETAKLEHYALVGGPRFGGQVVVAGDYGAEVLANTNGEVQAFVRTADGADLKGDAGLELEAKLPTVDAKGTLVGLHYDAARAAFVGKAEAGAAIAPGPLELHVKANGASHIGGLAELVLRANATHGGRVLVAGDYSMEVALEPGNVVAAYVLDASGKAHAKGDLDLDLRLLGDLNQNVKLVWDPATASYRAKLAAAVDFSTVPIEVNLKAGGRAFVGASGSLNAQARALADADLKARAAAEAELKAPSVKAVANVDATKAAAANASLKVTPPNINVSVKKSASASAGATAGTSAKASTGAKATTGGKASTGFSFGTH